MSVNNKEEVLGEIEMYCFVQNCVICDASNLFLGLTSRSCATQKVKTNWDLADLALDNKFHQLTDMDFTKFYSYFMVVLSQN